LSPYLFALYLDDLGKLTDPTNGCYVILYADDILLLSPSVTYLERLPHLCVNELAWPSTFKSPVVYVLVPGVI